MAKQRKKPRSGLLRRPLTVLGKRSGIPKSLKPQQARLLIRRFHVLQKYRSTVLSILGDDLIEANYKDELARRYPTEWKNNYMNCLGMEVPRSNEVLKIEASMTTSELVGVLGRIDAEVASRGGLEAYQSASIRGQDTSRGGDSSRKLVEWLKKRGLDQYEKPLHALEIGCLNPNNQISTCGIFESVTKIDLNSQSPEIMQQDFMKRPLPKLDHNNTDEKFNLISCSLVVNFVPTPHERGEMLRRITQFLKKPLGGTMSSLFLVLPLPCVTNSRYLDENLLNCIMKKLGFSIVYLHKSTKIIYCLYEWDGVQSNTLHFPKTELRPGSNRNNFCITFNE